MEPSRTIERAGEPELGESGISKMGMLCASIAIGRCVSTGDWFSMMVDWWLWVFECNIKAQSVGV